MDNTEKDQTPYQNGPNIPPRKEEQKRFFQQVLAMPVALQNRFYKQSGIALASVVLVSVIMAYFREWHYCIGYLIAVYLFYLALDIVWKYEAGMILRKRMIVVKATRLGGTSFYVQMRELNTDLNSDIQMYKFYMSVSKRDINCITQDTVMEIFFNPRNPLEIIAWEVIGNA